MDRQHPRDLFDVMQLLAHEGLTPGTRRAFVVYLASHNRPVHEVPFPTLRNIEQEYERNFKGMTADPVELASFAGRAGAHAAGAAERVGCGRTRLPAVAGRGESAVAAARNRASRSASWYPLEAAKPVTAATKEPAEICRTNRDVGQSATVGHHQPSLRLEPSGRKHVLITQKPADTARLYRADHFRESR